VVISFRGHLILCLEIVIELIMLLQRWDVLPDRLWDGIPVEEEELVTSDSCCIFELMKKRNL
jgi:hypothetical protein